MEFGLRRVAMGSGVYHAMHCPTGVPSVTRRSVQGGIRVEQVKVVIV